MEFPVGLNYELKSFFQVAPSFDEQLKEIRRRMEESQKRMEKMLVSLQPGLKAGNAARMAEVVLNINKALMGLYARSAVEDRAWIIEEYRTLLHEYFECRLNRGLAKHRGNGRVRSGRRMAANGRSQST